MFLLYIMAACLSSIAVFATGFLILMIWAEMKVLINDIKSKNKI